MKKRTVITGIAFIVVTAASAQNTPPPPPPPRAPIEELKAMPPSPPQAPVPPDAPPPPPPLPPEVAKGVTAPLPDDYQDFLQQNPSVTAIHRNNHAVTITLKGGVQERYPLNKSGLKEVEAKYGKLPIAPPPPPPPKRSKRTLS